MRRDVSSRVQTTLLLTAALVAGCGGGTPEPEARTSQAAAVSPLLAYDPIPPLLSDDGGVLPSAAAAAPADPGAATRALRYATAAQAGQVLAALADRSLLVDAPCCGPQAAESAAAAALALHRARGLDADAPVFVSGADARQAAAVADRLGELGLARVWTVTR